MGALWAVLGIATLSQTPPGITKASTWLTKPRVPCASQLPSCPNPAPSLPGWAPSTPLLLYQEEAVLPKHLPKTLKLSGYCYISRSSCPAPSLEPRTYTPPHSCSHLLDHSDNTGGGKAGWAWWKAAQHQCQHGTNMRPADV